MRVSNITQIHTHVQIHEPTTICLQHMCTKAYNCMHSVSIEEAWLEWYNMLQLIMSHCFIHNFSATFHLINVCCQMRSLWVCVTLLNWYFCGFDFASYSSFWLAKRWLAGNDLTFLIAKRDTCCSVSLLHIFRRWTISRKNTCRIHAVYKLTISLTNFLSYSRQGFSTIDLLTHM